MVWLVMAAIINGYELSAAYRPLPVGLRRATPGANGSGFRETFRRRLPLALPAGLDLSQADLEHRACDPAHLRHRLSGAQLDRRLAVVRSDAHIGVDDLATWQVIANVLDVFIGSPSDLDGGILLDAARIALLAAILEYAVATQRRATQRP